jgi:SH3 domain-containing YSC84-like protein 1
MAFWTGDDHMNVKQRFLPLILASILLHFPTHLAVAGPESEGREDPRARLQTPRDEYLNESRALIQEAGEVYRSFVQNKEDKIPDAILKKAQCVVVFPGVVTAAVIVGGTYGRGVASCKINGRWTTPAFSQISGGSIGLQLGGKSSDLVFFMLTSEAREALRSGEFHIGADASVVAGSYDTAIADPGSGVVAYVRSEGIYGGASITGASITRDQSAIRSYYGKKVSYEGLLSGQEYAGLQNKEGELSRSLPR